MVGRHGGQWPGPRVSEALRRGRGDLQAGYRTLVFDDARSSGSTLVDLDGNEFLDLFSSFGLGALGYQHPALVEAASSDAHVRAAANPTSTPFLTTTDWLDFVDDVVAHYAPRGMSQAFFVDSGGEGVDQALKAAYLRHGERTRVAAGQDPSPLAHPDRWAGWLANAGSPAVVLSFEGAFHGRGLGPLSATRSRPMHKADQPAFPWPVAPFPALRWPLERHADENERATEASLAAVDRVLGTSEVAAVIVEPIQSEGGDRHAAPAFFQGLRRLTAAAGVSLIVDEVQTGVGLTGELWATDGLDLPSPPDFVCFGKKMQLGGFFCAADASITRFGRLYQTRNGDRARAILARATLETIARDGLLAKARRLGATFLSGLVALGERFPGLVTEPRGRGLALAFDLPDTALRDAFNRGTLRRGVFTTYCGPRTVRLRPHLILTESEIDQALAVFHDTLTELACAT